MGKRAILASGGSPASTLFLRAVVTPSQWTGWVSKDGATIPDATVSFHTYGFVVTLPASYMTTNNIPSNVAVMGSRSGGDETNLGTIAILPGIGSPTEPKVDILSQAEYDAIATKDDNTVYVVV